MIGNNSKNNNNKSSSTNKGSRDSLIIKESNSNPRISLPFDSPSISKKKRKVLLKNEPKCPPTNIYSLFTKNSLLNMTDMSSSKDKLIYVSKSWKECTKEHKAELEAQMAKMHEEYNAKLNDFAQQISNQQDLEDFKLRHKSKIGKTLFL